MHKKKARENKDLGFIYSVSNMISKILLFHNTIQEQSHH